MNDGGRRRHGARRGGTSGGAGPAGHDGDPASPEEQESTARAICLRSLSHAPKTRRQLADTLARRGVPDDVAERVLDRFDEVGLIDDEAFARAWVQSRHDGRGLAGRALAAELRGRGVADETVRSAVAEVDRDRERATARRLVERRLPGTRGREPVARMRRLVGMLARRGYPSGMAVAVVREALAAETDADIDLPDGDVVDDQ